MEQGLELVECDLADDRVQHVLDLVATSMRRRRLTGSVSASNSARKVIISPNTLAVSARVSGVPDSLGSLGPPAMILVDAVAKLMCQRHNVASFAMES